MRRRRVPRPLLSLLLLGLLLLLAEWALHATGVVEDPETFRFARAARAVQDDDAGRYVLHPRRVYTLAGGYRYAPHHAGRYATTDAWPFRGVLPSPAPDDVARVIVLGDSCVYGAGVDVADALPERIARGLDARGVPRERVQVLDLGVPGYSTLQIAELLDEALAAWAPAAVVILPAAWNDQAPAMQAPDAALIAALVDPGPWDRLQRHSRIAAALARALERVPQDEVLAGWRAGDPPLGWRVAPDELVANVTRMLDACAARGRAQGRALPVVVISAAHPARTRADHPRTADDARAVREAAAAAEAALRAAGGLALTVIDAQARLAATGLDEAHLFVDYVHPSPEALARLGEDVADSLTGPLRATLATGAHAAGAAGATGTHATDATGAAAEAAGAATAVEPARSPLRILGVRPPSACALGDVEITLELAGWSASTDALPAVMVAGAPLLDLRAAGEHAVAGTLLANAPGPATLVVQTAQAVAVAREALELVAPRLVVEGPDAEGDLMLAFVARPGDVAGVRLSPARRALPEWTSKGAGWLDEAGLRSPWPPLVCGADGVVRVRVPRALLRGARAFAQALVAPAGEGGLPSPVAIWTPVVELVPDAR